MRSDPCDADCLEALARKPWLSPEEYRTLYQLGRSTVYGLLKQNAIEHRRLGRQIRIKNA